MRHVILLAVVLLTAEAKPVKAAEAYALGIACFPDSAAVQAGNYIQAFGGASYILWAGGFTGTITMYCPIPIQGSPSATSMKLHYKNLTSCVGCSADKVSFFFQKMNKGSGVITTIQTLDSSSGINDGSYRTVTATVTDAYTSTSVYFMKVEMARASTLNLQYFYSVEMYVRVHGAHYRAAIRDGVLRSCSAA